RIVGGLHKRFGAITASRVVKPSLLLVSALQNAVSTALPRGPRSKSICATSFPSPTSDSPTQTPLILAINQALPSSLKHFTPTCAVTRTVDGKLTKVTLLNAPPSATPGRS